jgi:hypothetical protein
MYEKCGTVKDTERFAKSVLTEQSRMVAGGALRILSDLDDAEEFFVKKIGAIY